jgi:hypothetical protein
MEIGSKIINSYGIFVALFLYCRQKSGQKSGHLSGHLSGNLSGHLSGHLSRHLSTSRQKFEKMSTY